MKWTWIPLTTCIVHVQWTKDNFYNSFSWFLFTHVQILTSPICKSIPRNSQTESLYEGVSRVPVCPSRVISNILGLVGALYNVPSPTQVYLGGGNSATKLSPFLLGEKSWDSKPDLTIWSPLCLPVEHNCDFMIYCISL